MMSEVLSEVDDIFRGSGISILIFSSSSFKLSLLPLLSTVHFSEDSEGKDGRRSRSVEIGNHGELTPKTLIFGP